MATMICEPETTTLTLADAVEHEARSYREQGTPSVTSLARACQKLAQLGLPGLMATTPEEHESSLRGVVN